MIPKLKYSLRKTIFSTKRIEQSECNNCRISPKKGGEQRTEKIEENFDTQDELHQLLKQARIDLDKTVKNTSLGCPVFSCSPMRFSPNEETQFKRIEKNTNNDLLAEELQEISPTHKYLRSYDIENIRMQRVLQSFTFGRKLRYSENCDERINKAIESMISTECCQRIPKLKCGDQFKADTIQNHPDSSVFKSLNYEGRTEDF